MPGPVRSPAFQDCILYRTGTDEAANTAAKAEAEILGQRQIEMLRAYGHTVICEMPVGKVIEEDLHRSTSAALLYVGRKPAITVELGTGHMPDPAIIQAAVAGTRNILRWAGMLDGKLEAINGIQVVDLGYPVVRRQTPRLKQAGVISHLVQAGDRVAAGQQVAELSDIWGRPLGDGYVYADEEGFVIGRSHGVFYYSGEAVLAMAVRNTQPIIEPYPADYFI
jgi:predicted deacylase